MNTLLLNVIVLVSSSSLYSMQNTDLKKLFLKKQIGYGALGTAGLFFTSALAAGTAVTFIFEGAEASQGDKKTMSGTITGTLLTTTSAGVTLYSFAKVYKLQKQKRLLK